MRIKRREKGNSQPEKERKKTGGGASTFKKGKKHPGELGVVIVL